MTFLNFIKVGPSEWSAWHRGTHYIVSQRGSKWILAAATSGNAAAIVDRFDSESLAKSAANALATPGRVMKTAIGNVDRSVAYGTGTKQTMAMFVWVAHVIDLAGVSSADAEAFCGRARIESWYTAGESVQMAADSLRQFVKNGKREAKAQGELDFLRKAATAPRSTPKANRWQHDGIEQNETWWYGPPDCEESDAIAIVSPEWSTTQTHGRGKPARWIVRVHGTRIADKPSRREATLAAEQHISAGR